MNLKEIEQKIRDLKAQQGDHFKTKKAERNVESLEALRTELSELKGQAKAAYLDAKKAKKKA